jgi:hypothetical protein
MVVTPTQSLAGNVIMGKTLKEYPLAGVRGYGPYGEKGWKTGEFREPKKGEYYLSGTIPEIYQAPNDLTIKFWICKIYQRHD